MKWTLSLAPWISAFAFTLLVCGAGRAQQFPSFHPDYPPPPDWTGAVFSLSQAYPQTLPPSVEHAWQQIDFKTDAFQYLRAVLDYALEGNVEADWNVAANTVRKWYHAPWMHPGCGGREFARGLTRERSSRPGELHANQTRFVDNWAVGIYNPPGGFVLGQVWKDPSAPDPSQANFPEGTVGIKLLFTAAAPEQVPYLQNSLVWQGNIYADTGRNPCASAHSERPRVMRDLSLLQLDVAVRDSRAEETGWVFGTFVYDASAEGETAFDRLVPVGVMWGNDPSVTDDMRRDGAFVNASLEENVINAGLIRSGDSWPENRAFVTHFGLGGRVNGPVDNKISSCMSCHGFSAEPSQPVVPNVAEPEDYLDGDFKTFFANVGPGAIDTGTFTRLDYSLQLAFGIRSRADCASHPDREGCGPVPELSAAPSTASEAMPLVAGAEISRDGGPIAAEWAPPATADPEGAPPSGSMPTWVWFAAGAVILSVLLVWALRRS
jgi:hypothetical protein